MFCWGASQQHARRLLLISWYWQQRPIKLRDWHRAITHIRRWWTYRKRNLMMLKIWWITSVWSSFSRRQKQTVSVRMAFHAVYIYWFINNGWFAQWFPRKVGLPDNEIVPEEYIYTRRHVQDFGPVRGCTGNYQFCSVLKIRITVASCCTWLHQATSSRSCDCQGSGHMPIFVATWTLFL